MRLAKESVVALRRVPRAGPGQALGLAAGAVESDVARMFETSGAGWLAACGAISLPLEALASVGFFVATFAFAGEAGSTGEEGEKALLLSCTVNSAVGEARLSSTGALGGLVEACGESKEASIMVWKFTVS